MDKELDCFNKNKTKSDGLSTECKICVSLCNAEYRKAHSKEASDYNKNYQQENKEELAAKHKDYIKKTRSKTSLRQHNWYKENQELTKERTRVAKLNNPLRYQNYANRRRAQKISSHVENFDSNHIILKYGNKCCYCGGKFEHIDHYMPLSKGGGHTLENVRPACRNCNLTKNNKTPEEWMELLKTRVIKENDHER